jgi:ATP adenylyltransferase
VNSDSNYPKEFTPQQRFASSRLFDRSLLESEHFLCVASLGSIVPGWVLVAPKRSVLNFTLLNRQERNELSTFVERVRRRVERRFGPTSAFEHGPAEIGSTAGCGVDQAHLHLVPIDSAMLRGAVEPFHDWHSTSAELPHELPVAQADYLWYSSAGKSWVAFPDKPQSQFFRRAIAAVAGAPSAWDYRAYPFLDNVIATQQALAGRLRAPALHYG